MKMFSEPHDVEDYLGVEFECTCGATHFAPIKAVEIGRDAINELPKYVTKYGYLKPYILCDEITYKIAGEKISFLLSECSIHSTTHILTHTGFDEATLGEIVVSVPSDADLMIGVGTGSITDITRYSSFRLGLPCFTVATGAPMDGFAASIGILNVNNMKKTMPAHCTEVIIGDTDILKGAPYRMTVAGFGDLIGKITCLNDWKLSSIITGERFCENIYSLVKKCVDDILSRAGRIKEKDPEVLGEVMKGLVLSGTCISLNGDSRPASGAEHHMSHYWETIKEQRGERAAMHGEQVAVGTVVVLKLAELLSMCDPDFDSARQAANTFDQRHWESEIRRAYGTAADEAIELERNDGNNCITSRLERINTIEENWQVIKDILKNLPSSEFLMSLLKDIGCPCTPEEIGIDKQLLKDAILFSKETRSRYTIFRLCNDLNLLESFADKLMSEL